MFLIFLIVFLIVNRGVILKRLFSEVILRMVRVKVILLCFSFVCFIVVILL